MFMFFNRLFKGIIENFVCLDMTAQPQIFMTFPFVEKLRYFK